MGVGEWGRVGGRGGSFWGWQGGCVGGDVRDFWMGQWIA